MAQVPYSPVPNVVPSAPAAPKVGVNTPPAAFGITTAEAEERLGGQVEKTGDMLAQNALAIKGIENETWAKDQFIQQSAKLGQLEADFYTKKGKNAWDAKDQYRNDVQQLYQDAIANAPNLQARRMLADTLSRRISYSIVDGQRHAGEQFQVYQNSVSTDRVADAMSNTAQHPDDDRRFGDNLAVLRSEARAQSEHSGGGTEEYNKKVEQYTSQAWEYRLQAIANTDPVKAKELFDKNKSGITGIAQNGEPYALKIEKMIQTQMNSIGARNAAHDILFGGVIARTGDIGDVEDALRADKSLTPAQRAGGAPLPAGWLQKHGVQTLTADSGPDFLQRALEKGQQYAREVQPNNPGFEDAVLARIHQDYNYFHDAYKQAEYGTYTSLVGAVIGANGGPRLANMDTIRNNPVLRDQWDKLGETASGRERQRQIETLVGNQYKAGSLDPADQTALFNRVMGLAIEAERDPTKRDEFTQMDLGSLSGQLSKDLMSKIYTEQQHIQRVWQGKADALERNNRLGSAMTFLKPTLENVGIRMDPNNKAKTDLYLEFQGALYQELTRQEAILQKPITDQAQIMAIARPLLQEIASDRSIWNPMRYLGATHRAFEVPAEKAAIIQQEWQSRPGNAGQSLDPMSLSIAYQRALQDPEWRKKLGL